MLKRVLMAAAATCVVWAADRKFQVGRTASPAEVSARDYSVGADGTGLPAGSGTAQTGKPLYTARCAECHGEQLQGDDKRGYPALAGGKGSIATPKPVKTVGSFWPYAPGVFDYIRRAMPYDNPHTLKNAEVYAITAYVLAVNGIIGEAEPMNEKTLPRVKMPNRDGFTGDTRQQKGRKPGL